MPVTGHTITFVAVPDDQMYNALKGGGDKMASTLVAMFSAMRDVGCEQLKACCAGPRTC